MDNSIGEKIREMRERKHISQFAMAFNLDMSQAAYSKIERGVTEIKAIHLYKIAGALGTSVYELLPPALEANMALRGSLLVTPIFNYLRSVVNKFVADWKK